MVPEQVKLIEGKDWKTMIMQKGDKKNEVVKSSKSESKRAN